MTSTPRDMKHAELSLSLPLSGAFSLSLSLSLSPQLFAAPSLSLPFLPLVFCGTW